MIAERAVEHIATHVACGVDGVAPDEGSGLTGALTRSYPRAAAHVAGNRTSVQLEIAVAWPSSLAATTAAVRDTVRARISELAGLEVDAVDVTAARVVHVHQVEPRRVQ